MTGGQWEEKKKRRLVDVDGAKIQLDNNAIKIDLRLENMLMRFLKRITQLMTQGTPDERNTLFWHLKHEPYLLYMLISSVQFYGEAQ